MRKAIGFDLDGTLWDTVAGCVGGWNAALARHPEAGARLTEEAMRSYMGLTTEEIAARLLPELPLSSALPIMDECTQEEYAYLRSVGGWHLFPGVREGLERLARDYDLFLVSNCQCGYIELFLELSGTKEFVRAHLCPGDTGKRRATTSAWCWRPWGARAPFTWATPCTTRRRRARPGCPLSTPPTALAGPTRRTRCWSAFPTCRSLPRACLHETSLPGAV